ncbi:MAG: phosphatidylserine decarboxylase-domain-containing protein, partial [Linnemannia elongata]
MSDQQQQQEEYAPTPSVAAAEETESITSLEDYVQKCAGRLEATVANSCANEDDGHPLSNGGILTSANHKTWFPYVHPYQWIHKVYQAYRYGNYVIVDRKTGKTEWEDMPVYARIGMHLLFACQFDHRLLETHRLQNLFLKESQTQGKHFDDPASVSHIGPFIKTYKLDLTELLEENVANYGTFNEFFYRKLKENARPIDSKDDPTVITSAADCRLAVFDSISTAQELWIKGQKFTLPTFLQDLNLASEFDQSSMAIFRLAPQDYHRFHCPVKATVSSDREPVKVGGTYFTVNPMAVNENLDVFTENVRVVSVLDIDGDGGNEAFDRCVFVSIGALLVGSIVLTGGKVPGTKLEKGDELGYFAYGGSTCILLFKKGAVQFDQDLIENSKKGVETLVRMGEHIGHR